jgi:hypothetical protein
VPGGDHELMNAPLQGTGATGPVAAPVADPVEYADLVPFLLMTFGLAWGVIGLFVLLPEPMVAVFGELSGAHPLFLLAVYAPAIAAIVLVLRRAGWQGLVRFLARVNLWRCPRAWWTFLILGIPCLFFVGGWIGGELGEYAPREASASALILALLLNLVRGPVEEIGWRGMALPLLQRRCTPLAAGLGLGLIWSLWHLPAFVLSGTPQAAWSFAPFFIGAVAAAVIMTPLFNVSGGSIGLAALFHFQLVNPLWPDAQPWDMYAFAIAAVAIVWLNRHAMLAHEAAATTVVPGPSADGDADARPP